MAEERDFILARTAVARAAAQRVIDAIDELVTHFVDPSEDKKGRERQELMEAILDDSGQISRAIEAAQEIMPEVDFSE